MVLLLVAAALGAGVWYSTTTPTGAAAFAGVQQQLSSITLPSSITQLFGGTSAATEQLRVNGDSALPVHAEPASTGAEVATVPAGTSVEWIDGPQSADGTAWLKIRFLLDGKSIEGWVPQQRLTTQTP